MLIKLFTLDDDGQLQTHTESVHLLARKETKIEISPPFQPQAILLNSGIQGYARVILDFQSVKFMLENISKLGDQLDRSYVWSLLGDHIRLLLLPPKQYIECFLKNIEHEEEQMTVQRILAEVAKVIAQNLEDDDREELSAQIFDTLLKKTKNTEIHSLRNVIINNMLAFATNKKQILKIKTFLKGKAIPLAEEGKWHALTKAQRYQILRAIFKERGVPESEKNELLLEEMNIDYSDVDELEKIGC